LLLISLGITLFCEIVYILRTVIGIQGCGTHELQHREKEIIGDLKVKGRKKSRLRKINYARIEVASATRNKVTLPKTT
jgi:hypothetical protein